jgi:HAMP domain-containing protein
MAKGSSNTGLIVGLAAVVGAAAFFLWGSVGTRIQNLQISFKSFASGISFSFPNLKIPIDIYINNPNKKALTFQQINCDVYINNVKTTVLKYSTPVVLPAGQTTTLKKILIQTEVFSTLDKSLDLLNKSVSVQIKGYLKADNFNFPVNESIKIQ